MRAPILLAGGALTALAVVAFIGFRNMPPDPAYVTVDRYGFSAVDIVREMLPALAFGVAGLVAWQKRPQRRIGPLMLLISAAILLKGFQGVPVPIAVSLGIWGSVAPGVVPSLLLGILVLLYPTGRFVSRIERGWVIAAVLYLTTAQLAWALWTPATRDSLLCLECYPLTQWVDGYVRVNLRNLSLLMAAGLAITLVLVVLRRWIRASTPARRMMGPIWVGGAVVAVVTVLSSVMISSIRSTPFDAYSVIPNLGDVFAGRIPLHLLGVVPWVVGGSMMILPAVLVWGLLRSHLSHVAVSALAIELGRTRGRPPLVDSLRRALGDQSLELALWSRPAHAYVSPDGSPMTLPASDDHSVTRLDGDDGPLAAMIHDPALGEQRQFIDGVAAVARLSIENERLHAEVKAQLEEVRASRERLVSAADDERRRVERNLHDGAQQRLVSLAMALRMAQVKATHSSPEVASTLGAAEAELRMAIGELRDLARGIHPAILTEAGLGPALSSLADHLSVPVTIQASLDGCRLPSVVETTAYYVVAEALTNVVKHAQATEARVVAGVSDGRLRLSVSDDGNGGADLSGGTGLRGLADRVVAIGGRLQVSAPASGGTLIEAEIPCA